MQSAANEVSTPRRLLSANRTAWQSRLITLIQAGLLLTLFIALFAVVQFATPGLAGNDGYYHIKMGYLIRQEGLTPTFDVLPYTILNAADYYDHHLLYHVYLALFAGVDPAQDGGLGLTQGAKLASILMPSLTFLAIWWLLRGQRVPYAALWAVALFVVSEAFLYRMSMPRAQAASLLLLALGLHWLLKERYWLLAPLGFVYVWFYNAFPLLLVMAAAYVGLLLVMERRLAWQALAFPALGIGLGVVINPYFPENLVFIVDHLLPKVGESSTPVGNEWSPYRTLTVLENSGLALLAMVGGVLAMGWQRTRADKAKFMSFLLAVFFGYMLFQSRRFVEYFPAFALIFAALAAAPLLREWSARWRARVVEWQRPYLAFAVPLVGILLLAYPLTVTLSDARDLMSRSKDAETYADAMLWLNGRAAHGTFIFQTDWDDFTRLFFYNSDFVYTAGLDPTFMEIEDPARYDEWVDITRGRVEQPSEAIRERFGGQYVFSDLAHDSFIKEAENDPALQEVYRDDYAVIFELLE